MSNRSTRAGSWLWIRRLLGIGIVAGLAGAAWSAYRRYPEGQQSRNRKTLALAPVKRGPLTIDVTAMGTIQNRQQEIIKCEVEGITTILWLIEEGKNVKKGDLLFELDSSKLTDALNAQQIVVMNKEASWISAREELAVAESRSESDISKAELELRFAKEDLKQYLEGEYPQLLKEAKTRITIAEEELKRARDKLTWSETLSEENYLSRMELEADKLAARRTELELELRKGELGLLEKYTYERRITKLKSDIDQSTRALDRVRRKASADIIQAQADLKAKESELERQKAKLEKYRGQLAKCRVLAPVSGMVVYATTGKGNWRGNAEPLAEGQQIRERQEIIYLPTATSKMARVKVHESHLKKIGNDMLAKVVVEALPGSTYWGKVRKIAMLPDAQSMWLNPDLKVYDTEVHLYGDVEGLRPGMTCRVNIIVAEYEEADYVPVQSVVRHGRKAVVYTIENGKPVPREVEIGLDNNRVVRVLAGLKPGEEVMLDPPLSSSDAPGIRTENRQAGPSEKAARGAKGKDGSGSGKGAKQADSGPEAGGAPSPAAAAGGGTVDLSKLRNLSPEQRRKFFENLTPEQREKLRSMRAGRHGGDRGPEGKGGGAPGAGRPRAGSTR